MNCAATKKLKPVVMPISRPLKTQKSNPLESQVACSDERPTTWKVDPSQRPAPIWSVVPSMKSAYSVPDGAAPVDGFWSTSR